MTRLFHLARTPRPAWLLAASLLALPLAGCMGFGGGGGGQMLPTALTASMEAPGAELDRVQALALINSYRASRGVQPLANDPGLDGSAQALAQQYMATGTAPGKPPQLRAMRLSAGYQSFAETFSGWRNVSADAAALADPSARRAGLAVVSSPNSGYGVYWVLLLDQ